MSLRGILHSTAIHTMIKYPSCWGNIGVLISHQFPTLLNYTNSYKTMLNNDTNYFNQPLQVSFLPFLKINLANLYLKRCEKSEIGIYPIPLINLNLRLYIVVNKVNSLEF